MNIQSFHSLNLLVLADEAPGIEEDIWDSLQGIMAGGNVRLLKLGNPTVPSGEFFDDFGKNRGACHGITISAFDSPNLAGVTLEALMEMDEDELAISPWPFLTTRRWVRDFVRKWGVNHPKVRARVFGEFPPQADNATFPLAWLERAALPIDDDAMPPKNVAGLIQVGIDVAGPGDDNTVMVAASAQSCCFARAGICQIRAARSCGGCTNCGLSISTARLSSCSTRLVSATTSALTWRMAGTRCTASSRAPGAGSRPVPRRQGRGLLGLS